MSTATQSAVLERIATGIEDMTERVQRLEDGHNKQEEWIAEVERRVSKRDDLRPGAIKRDRPPVATLNEDEWREERWLRGFLLSGCPGQSYRETGAAVMEDTFPGRLQDWMAKRREFERHTRATLVSSSDIVPVPIFSDVFSTAAEAQSVRAASRVIPLENDVMKLPTIASAFTAALVEENSAFPDGAGSYTSVSYDAIKFGSQGTITLELLEDAAFPVASEFFRRVRDAANELENLQALEGDGTGNNFEGLFTVSGVNSVTLGASPTDLDELFEIVTSIKATAITPAECRWFMTKEAARKILQIKEGTTNAPMVQQNGRLTELLGYPVSLTEQIDNTRGGGSNETTVYWGNFRQGMVIGDRGAEHLDTSISATDAVWNNGLVGVRYFRRTAIAVVLPELFVKGTGMTV